MGKNRLFGHNVGEKLPSYHTEDEIGKMLETANENNQRDYLILKLFFETGLRLSELANLQKKHIRFKSKDLEVRDGKGGKDRVVPLITETRNLLQMYLNDRSDNEQVFKISKRQIQNIVSKYGELNNIDTHAHKWRHTFAVYSLKQGMDLRTIQKILGHASLDTTQIYLELVTDDIKKEYNKVFE